MANRYGYEDEPRRWHEGRRADREPWQEREVGERPGGGYGIGGAERGYNMGGHGGMGSYEQGYRPGSYDRLLDATERYHAARGNPDYGWERDEDERDWYTHRPMPPSVGFGGEPWSDEWMSFEHSRSERPRQEPRAMEWTARGRGPGKGPRSYTRSDERIHEDVCERLMHSPYDASDVEITVSRGEVTLAGTVRSRADKWGIEDVAESVLGVQDVHNQIRVNREGFQASEVTLGGDTGHLHS
ncbi:BON domain-containing protein [Hyalangium gracile]|uniref:BON domain-containing protein n=1 Tax=Hyalangium gracile TaxID=394092 RepID=UPI001CCA25DD|nr:BON domain-containing protein [Hyalangium gracile]